VFSTGSAQSKDPQNSTQSSAVAPGFAAKCEELTSQYRIGPSLPPEEGLKVLSNSWQDQQGQGVESEEYPDLRGFLWTQLVARLQAGDVKAMEELYAMFSNGVRFYLARQLGRDDIEDRLHDSFLVVVEAIRSGELRDPRRLMGFIRTVVKRTVSSSISKQMAARRRNIDDERTANVSDPAATPERALLFRQQASVVREVLAELSDRDREILTRFYVQEQSAQQICEDMDLTVTQFRLLKSRAKNRFGELGRKKVQKSGLSQVLLRFCGR
jgi:RNA polymerase sigma-70 factor, ECF subfamily